MTADTERTAQGDTDGRLGARWSPGTHILWRYRANGRSHPHICRPMTVVRDTPELLAAWMAPGTQCVKPQLADGTPVHREPLATRYTKPRTVARCLWFGTGVLKLARPGDPWSVWLFWEPEWRFKNWYVNLEEPLRRWSGGVDSEDHFLDIEVMPDRSWRWRDEDEFTQAQAAGLMGARQAAGVREAGRAALDLVRAWGPPFTDGWEHWRPDPTWTVPRLPADWDRPGWGRTGNGARPTGPTGPTGPTPPSDAGRADAEGPQTGTEADEPARGWNRPARESDLTLPGS